jgi:hypothetical protein
MLGCVDRHLWQAELNETTKRFHALFLFLLSDQLNSLQD